jgi:ketosteroid isomerase-like protein
MSHENVEILRRAVEAFDRGAEDEWIAAWHPDAELYDFTELPDVPQPYRGHEGVRRWATNVRSVLGDSRMNPRAYATRRRGTHGYRGTRCGRTERGSCGMTVHVLACIQCGKIARTRAFLDRTQALEAAGLRG